MARHPTPAKPAHGIVVTDDRRAPVIYFDGAPNFGANGGIVNITLAMARHLSAGDRIASDIVAVAHLRCSVQAAADLRKAIDDALLLHAPVSDNPS